MIKITLQPEPEYFDLSIRQKGLKWLSQNDINTELPTYWRNCKDDLYRLYHQVCAYYCIGIDEISGASTIDHFKPKSKYRNLAYEWDNYRLACALANSNKLDYEDVLDPFEVPQNLFQLYLFTGEIKVNPDFDSETISKACDTIKRLKLDAPKMNKRRQKDFIRYSKKQISLEELNEQNPFVYVEVVRQNYI